MAERAWIRLPWQRVAAKRLTCAAERKTRRVGRVSRRRNPPFVGVPIRLAAPMRMVLLQLASERRVTLR